MNNVIPFSNQTLTMSSREIAELVGSYHQNVRRSIERLAKQGVIQLPPKDKVEDKQSLSPNNKTDVYVFSGEQGKRDSIIVVAQLCPEFTAKLVDRWQELESQVQQQVPSTTIGILKLAVSQMEEFSSRLDSFEKRLPPPDDGRVTIRQYVLANDLEKFNLKSWQLSSVGKRANNMLRSRGLKTKIINNDWFGPVCTYPPEILSEAFDKYFIDMSAPDMFPPVLLTGHLNGKRYARTTL